MKEEGRSGFADALHSVPLFSQLKKNQLERVVKLGHDMSFRSGQTIVKEGELGIGFYVILDGAAEV
ncbi:MAG: hypothetical protein ABSG92_04820, partial [Conexivisphaerales archaeon]